MTLETIAIQLNADLINQKDVEIRSIGTLDNAPEGSVVVLLNKKYQQKILESPCSAIVTAQNIVSTDKPQLIVKEAQLAFIELLQLFHPARPLQSGVAPTAIIGSDAVIHPQSEIGHYCVLGDKVQIGEGTKIHPHVTIGQHVIIGRNCIIYPNVSIYDRTIIGDDVIIHSGTVIGGDGYGFFKIKGKYTKIPQVGRVVIGNQVEIGSLCTIDRATIGETVIGHGTKFDNLVHVAHNVTIGEDVLLVAQVGIAGSSHIGNRCILAGQAGIADHVTLGDDVIIGAQSGTKNSLSKPGIYFGSPCREFSQAARIIAALDKLPDLPNRVSQLEKQLSANITESLVKKEPSHE